MKRALFINGNRNAYGPDQVEYKTFTLSELIAALEELQVSLDGDALVYLRNDGGYTYGSINWGDFVLGEYDESTVVVDNDFEL